MTCAHVVNIAIDIAIHQILRHQLASAGSLQKFAEILSFVHLCHLFDQMDFILLSEFESVSLVTSPFNDGAMMRAMNLALDGVKATFSFDFNFDCLYGDVSPFAIVAIL